MGVQYGVANWERVLIDVCTQRDYLDAGAILQVANRASLLANLRDLFRWIRSERLAVVSIVESHRPAEPANGFPLHCIDGTDGQQKLPFTLLEPRFTVETDNYLCLPPRLREDYRQLLFRKRARDILGNPKADRFLTQLEPDEFIICGVGLERAIRSLALGLLARHKTVTVVADACGHWSAADAELAGLQLSAKGVRVTTTAEMVVPPPTLPTRSAHAAGRRDRRYLSRTTTRRQI